MEVVHSPGVVNEELFWVKAAEANVEVPTRICGRRRFPAVNYARTELWGVHRRFPSHGWDIENIMKIIVLINFA